MYDETSVQNQKNNGNINKGLVVICFVAMAVIIVLLCIVISSMYSKQTNSVVESTETKRQVVVVSENAEEVAEQILNQTEPEGIPLNYQVTMNSTWEFEDGNQNQTMLMWQILKITKRPFISM